MKLNALLVMGEGRGEAFQDWLCDFVNGVVDTVGAWRETHPRWGAVMGRGAWIAAHAWDLLILQVPLLFLALFLLLLFKGMVRGGAVRAWDFLTFPFRWLFKGGWNGNNVYREGERPYLENLAFMVLVVSTVGIGLKDFIAMYVESMGNLGLL